MWVNQSGMMDYGQTGVRTGSEKGKKSECLLKSKEMSIKVLKIAISWKAPSGHRQV
jgi:hypothetical protein